MKLELDALHVSPSPGITMGSIWNFLRLVSPLLVLASHAVSLHPGASLFSKRSITCLAVGSTATAKWKNAEGLTCTYTDVVGSNYGLSGTGEEYSCMGRCGAGCSGRPFGNAYSVYTQDCFTHDVCSYFSESTSGARDPNCGQAFRQAISDTMFGMVRGCQQKNPQAQVAKPAGAPKCTRMDDG